MAWDMAVVLLQEGRFDPREWIEAGQGVALAKTAGLKVTGHLVRTERQREELAATLQHRAPRFTLILVGSGQGPAALALLNGAVPMRAGSLLAVGGPHGSLCSHDFTAHRGVDGVLLGDWVETVRDIGLAMKKAEILIEQIPGMWWRTPHGWKLTGRRASTPDLEGWPDPDLADLRAHDVCRLAGGSMPLLASRGFPFPSVVSAEPLLRNIHARDGFYHLRPPARVAAEAAVLKERHSARHFAFADEIFPWQEEWVSAFLRFWHRHVNVPFSIHSAAEHLPEPRLNLMRKYGLDKVEFLVEGGDEELRRRLTELNISNKSLFQTLGRCEKLGIATRLRLMLGVPGETAASLGHTMDFAEASHPSELEPEIFHPWPTSNSWFDLERSLTGSVSPHIPNREQVSLGRNLVVSCQELLRADMVRRAERRERNVSATLDGLADFPTATVRSPMESPVRLTRFSSPTATHEVLALRVPAEIEWKLVLLKDPVVQFGMLVEPALPGERSRLPISFSIKIRQGGRTWRVFQKIILQAMDPDSREWRFFKLPISGASRGEAHILFESLVFGEDANFIPPERDIWAGWARVIVTSATQRENLENTDQELLQ